MQGVSQHDFHYDNPSKPKVKRYHASLTLITWGIKNMSKGERSSKNLVSGHYNMDRVIAEDIIYVLRIENISVLVQSQPALINSCYMEDMHWYQTAYEILAEMQILAQV